jgi:hypothetical protein
MVDAVPVVAGSDNLVGKGYKESENKWYGAVEPLYHVSNVLVLREGLTAEYHSE